MCGRSGVLNCLPAARFMNKSGRFLTPLSRGMPENPILFTICLIGLTALLLYPVYINGFPILNYDTGTYLESALTFKVPADRPIGYSLLLTVVRITNSLRLVVFIQAIITAYLLIVFLQYCLGYRPYLIASFLMGVIILTPLPFMVSFLYPDITSFWIPLAGLIFLQPEPSLSRKIITFLILTFSVLTSYVNVGLVLFTVIVIRTANFISSPSKAGYLKRKGLAIMGLMIFFFILPPGLNLFLDHGFSFSKTSHVFIFGNYLSGGRGGVLREALLNLEETDPKNPLNDHLDLLLSAKKRGPSWFLWSGDSPLNTDPRLSGWVSNRKYLQPIISETVRNEFPALLEKIGREFLQQLFIIQPGYICRRVGERAKIFSVLKNYFPALNDQYLLSLQNRGRLLEIMTENRVDGFFRLLFIVTAVSAIILLLIIPVLVKMRPSDLPGFNSARCLWPAVFLVLFYLFSTLLVVATGGTSPRYSTRVSALVMLAFFLIIFFLSRLMLRGGAEE
jgi:hypothetical protein